MSRIRQYPTAAARLDAAIAVLLCLPSDTTSEDDAQALDDLLGDV